MIAENKDNEEGDHLRDAMDETCKGMTKDPEFKIHMDGLEGLHGWIGKGYGIFPVPADDKK